MTNTSVTRKTKDVETRLDHSGFLSPVSTSQH